jgi:DNA primase
MSDGGPVLQTFERFVDGLRPTSGSNWSGFCPLHGEQKGKSRPSFSVNVVTGTWHCFAGCGGGGMPSLLKRLGKSSEYVDRTMERLRPHIVERRRKETSFASGEDGPRLFCTDYPLPEKLLGLYERVPLDLVAAGFSEEVLFENDVGYDIDLDRITFPIRDVEGTLAGLAGRTMSGESKYVVYERELEALGFRNYHFSNRNFLWRCDKVYQSLYTASPESHPTIYVTEGYKACLWMVQHGLTNTVALMGTGLSEQQRMFLQRLGARVVLCLDNNRAGRIGTSKAGYKLRGVRVAVMRYPDPESEAQPDDLEGRTLIAGATSPLSLSEWRRIYHEYSS